MKHRRGIDLSAPFEPVEYYAHDPKYYDTIARLRDWEVLGAQCGKCGHIGWLDKEAVLRKWGNHYLLNLRNKIRCQCGNKADNKILIGALPR